MSADRIVLIVCLIALFAGEALPMTRSERKAATFAREAKVDACYTACRSQCIPLGNRP